MELFTQWNTMMDVLLITVIFLAILTEIKTAGMGVGAVVGLLAAGMFFYAQTWDGMTGWMEIGCFLLGTVFLLLEILVTGVGIFGMIGAALIFVSLIWAMGGDFAAIQVLLAALILSAALFAVIASRLPTSRLWQKVVLRESTSADAGYNSVDEPRSLIGSRGKVITKLRPAGKADISGRIVDVVSEGSYIDEGKTVEVIDVVGVRIVVKEVK